MSDFLSGLTKLATSYKGIGGKWLKATALELFFDTYHDEIVKRLAIGLALIPPEDVGKIIHDKIAMPIPPHFYQKLKGFEDFIEGFDPGRLFELISEANPLIAAAIMDEGEEGAAYMVKFKAYVVTTVRALEVPEEETPVEGKETTLKENKAEPKLPAKPPAGMTRLKCDKCDESWDVPADDVSGVKECPFCHDPA